MSVWARNTLSTTSCYSSSSGQLMGILYCWENLKPEYFHMLLWKSFYIRLKQHLQVDVNINGSIKHKPFYNKRIIILMGETWTFTCVEKKIRVEKKCVYVLGFICESDQNVTDNKKDHFNSKLLKGYNFITLTTYETSSPCSYVQWKLMIWSSPQYQTLILCITVAMKTL